MDIAQGHGRAACNEQCIKLLKSALKFAKKGTVSYVAMVMAAEPGEYFHQSGGSIAFEPGVVDTLGFLRHKINQMCEERNAPVFSTAPANAVTFSINANIVCYDFIPWLINAEMWRRRHKGPAPLEVAFYGIKQEGVELPETQRQMIQNVIGPLVQAIGGRITKIQGGPGNFALNNHTIVEAHKRGEEVPKFKATRLASEAMKQLLEGVQPPVTITLREADYYQNRNSNLEAWTKFARDLVKKGENVIFVRDTAKAEEPLEDFITMPVASENTLMRIALYEQAKCNLFVANGPATINWHLDTPFLFFSELDCEHKTPYEPCWPEWWPEYMGIDAGAGEQFPWFGPDQRIVWKTDSYENLSEAWEARPKCA